MSLSINQNIMAMNSYRNLSSTQNGLSKSLEKLSSGFRINRAADDAAGLAISEGLRSQVGGNKQAVRNAQDGISVVQTAEGALQEVHAILQRQRDLAVQAANDSNSDEARSNIKTEMDQLTAELGRIAEATNFNGAKLLDGSVTEMQFQVGANGDQASRITVDLTDADVSKISGALDSTNGTEATVNDKVAASEAFDVAGIQAGNTVKFTLGTGSKEVTTAALGANATAQDVANAFNTAIQGDSVDAEVKGKYAASVNADGQLVITGKDKGTGNSAIAAANASVQGGAGQGTVNRDQTKSVAAADTSKMTGIDVSSHLKAQESIKLIDSKISAVSTARANLGAVQNRFEHTINNLNVAVENLSASESRIRDTDMAQEMMGFTRNQILAQAGTAMLAQANQVPQGVLSLLR